MNKRIANTAFAAALAYVPLSAQANDLISAKQLEAGAAVGNIGHPPLNAALANQPNGALGFGGSVPTGVLYGNGPSGLTLAGGVATAWTTAPDLSGGMLFRRSGPGQLAFERSGAPALAPIFDVVAFGASPSASATANYNAFQAAFTAAAAVGGRVHVPCGYYALNGTPAATVAAGKRFSMIGDGQDCAVLAFQGAINGPTLTLASGLSSFDFQEFTVVTNTAGGQRAFDVEMAPGAVKPATGSGSTYGPANFFNNVNYFGDDVYGLAASTHFWSEGWHEVAINNTTFYGGICLGANLAANVANGAQHTDCITAQGTGAGGNFAPGAYSVVINLIGYTAANCASMIKINDFFQGLQTSGVNVTACGRGAYQALTTPAGYLTEISNIGGQFFTTIAAFDIESPSFAGLFVQGAQIAGTGALIKVQGTQYELVGNNLACATINGPTGVKVAGGATYNGSPIQGQGGKVSDNTISDCNFGISVAPGVATLASFSNNHFVGNGYSSFTGAISNGSGAAGFQLAVSGYPANTPPLTPGTYINGPGIAPGTHIVAFASGTGRNGAYTVANSTGAAQLTPSTGTETMTSQWLGASSFDYVFGAGSSNNVVNDFEPRNFMMLPPCNLSDWYSEFTVTDARVNTFHAPITAGGGAHVGRALCNPEVTNFVLE
jgi:hypothetical protein